MQKLMPYKNRPKKTMPLIVLTIGVLILAAPARADKKVYDLALDGTPVGIMTITHDVSGDSYAFSADYTPNSFIGALTEWQFHIEASGSGTKYQRYLPTNAASTIVGRDFWIDRQLRIDDNEIELSVTPFVETNIDHQSVGDAVDWATALAYATRDQSPTRICSLAVPVYEGDFLMRLFVQKPSQLDATRFRCNGAVRLEQGFENTRFENGTEYYFAAVFRQIDSGDYTLDRMLIPTPLGELSIVDSFNRRDAAAIDPAGAENTSTDFP